MDNIKLMDALRMNRMYRDYLEEMFGIRQIDSLDEFEAKIKSLAGNRNVEIRLATLENMEKKLLSAMIMGGIKMSIDAHGPVNHGNITSAVKRVVGYLMNFLNSANYGQKTNTNRLRALRK